MQELQEAGKKKEKRKKMHSCCSNNWDHGSFNDCVILLLGHGDEVSGIHPPSIGFPTEHLLDLMRFKTHRLEDDTGPYSEGVGGEPLDFFLIFVGIEIVECHGGIPHTYFYFCRGDKSDILGGIMAVDCQRGVGVMAKEIYKSSNNVETMGNGTETSVLGIARKDFLLPIVIVLLGSPTDFGDFDFLWECQGGVCTEEPSVVGFETKIVKTERSGVSSAIEFGLADVVVVSILCPLASAEPRMEGNNEPIVKSLVKAIKL